MSVESSTSLTEQQYMGNQATNESSDEGFFSGIIKKFTDNKIYIGILVGVLVLGVVLYYFYRKNKKETHIKSDNVIIQENTSQQTNQALEGQALEGQALEGQALEGQALEGQALEGQALEGQALEQRQLLEYQAMQQQLAMQRQALEHQAMQKQAMQKQAYGQQAHEQQAHEQQALQQRERVTSQQQKIEHPTYTDESEKSDEDSGNDLKQYDLTQSEIQQITEKLKGKQSNQEE